MINELKIISQVYSVKIEAMNKIKDNKLQIILNLFKLISEESIAQLSILRKLFDAPTDRDLLEEAESNEIIIDRLEMKMREEIGFTILMFAPMAEDLRRIISYQDLSTNLERVGDLVLNCIHEVSKIDLNSSEIGEYHPLLTKMLDNVTIMITNGIRSFTTMDQKMAQEVIDSDDAIDNQMYDAIELIAKNYSHKSMSTKEVREMLRIQSIVNNLERCGDQATNIAECTVYLVRGTDPKHEEEMI